MGKDTIIMEPVQKDDSEAQAPDPIHDLQRFLCAVHNVLAGSLGISVG